MQGEMLERDLVSAHLSHLLSQLLSVSISVGLQENLSDVVEGESTGNATQLRASRSELQA